MIGSALMENERTVSAMYDELVEALRCESVINDVHSRCESCKYGVVVCHGSREDVYGCDSRRIENDAADAIERLTAEVDRKDKALQEIGRAHV